MHFAHHGISFFRATGEEIPSDNHVRSLLDGVPAERFYPVVDAVFDELTAVSTPSGTVVSFVTFSTNGPSRCRFAPPPMRWRWGGSLYQGLQPRAQQLRSRR